MGKIRSLQELEDKLDREYSWRKHELTSLKFCLKGARNHQVSVFFRGAIVLLYAHWEGLTKECAKNYIRYVNHQGLSYKSLQSCFLIFAVKSEINSSGKVNLNNFDRFDSCRHFFNKPLDVKFNVDPDACISTRENQNMTSAEFRFLIGKLGLTYHNQYQLRENMIDEQLLSYRNRVAHGEALYENPLEFPDIFERLTDSILELLELMRSEVITSIENKKYLS